MQYFFSSPLSGNIKEIRVAKPDPRKARSEFRNHHFPGTVPWSQSLRLGPRRWFSLEPVPTWKSCQYTHSFINEWMKKLPGPNFQNRPASVTLLELFTAYYFATPQVAIYQFSFIFVHCWILPGWSLPWWVRPPGWSAAWLGRCPRSCNSSTSAGSFRSGPDKTQ